MKLNKDMFSPSSLETSTKPWDNRGLKETIMYPHIEDNPSNPIIPTEFLERYQKSGLIILVTAIPTQSMDENGKKTEAIGGVGETEFVDEIACQIGSTEPLKTGAKQRANHTEQNFYEERLGAPAKIIAKQDAVKDQEFVDEAILAARQHRLVVVSSKLMPFIIARELAKDTTHSLPAVIVIGILGSDDLATELFQKRIETEELTKQFESPAYIPHIPDKTEARILRVNRYKSDARIFKLAHGKSIPEYTRNNVRQACNLFIHNTERLNKGEFKFYKATVAREILDYITHILSSADIEFDPKNCQENQFSI